MEATGGAGSIEDIQFRLSSFFNNDRYGLGFAPSISVNLVQFDSLSVLRNMKLFNFGQFEILLFFIKIKIFHLPTISLDFV